MRYTDPSGHCIVGLILGRLFGVSYTCPEPLDSGSWIDIFIGENGGSEADINVPIPPDAIPGFVSPPDVLDDGPEVFDPIPDDDTLGVIAEEEDDDDDDDNDDWESKKPEEGTVENPDGTTTTFKVRKKPGRDGGWSRIVIVRDENGNVISVEHEAWEGTSDPRVDPPDHKHPKPINNQI